MFMKYFMLAFSLFALKNRGQNSDTDIHSTDFIKKIIRAEVSAIGLRLLAGLVLASTIIFSFIYIGKGYHLYLNQFQNGLTIELVTFAVVALVCSLGIFFLFSGNQNFRKLPRSSSAEPIDLPLLAIIFVQGFMESVKTPTN